MFHNFGLIPNVVTLALGLWLRQGLARLRAKRGNSRVKKSVREWSLTLPRELSPWELESWWTLECSKSNCKGQNSMDWGFCYIIEKLLKLMSKMGLHAPFGHLNHKLWPKERLGVNLAIWFLTTKIRESTWFPCV
jgi:hypothetical protein